jgi:hypothetical protein
LQTKNPFNPSMTAQQFKMNMPLSPTAKEAEKDDAAEEDDAAADVEEPGNLNARKRKTKNLMQ